MRVVAADERMLLASGGKDRDVRIWDPASAACLGAAVGGHAGAVTALAFTNRTASLLISGGADHLLKVRTAFLNVLCISLQACSSSWQKLFGPSRALFPWLLLFEEGIIPMDARQQQQLSC